MSTLKEHRPKKFQSTLPREERHTLRRYKFVCAVDFNPRSHERSDKSLKGFTEKNILFQSTLPREERLIDDTESVDDWNFNPRSHERSDYRALRYRVGEWSFQSTLPREERQSLVRADLYHGKFQSTLPREERRKASDSPERYKQFQSTLPREERQDRVSR